MSGDDEPLHPDVRRLVRTVQSHDDAVVALHAAIDELSEKMSSDALIRVFVMAARETIQDKEMMDTFVHDLYAGFVAHGKDDSARWIGGKILAWFSSAMVGLGLFLVWEFGLKK